MLFIIFVFYVLFGLIVFLVQSSKMLFLYYKNVSTKSRIKMCSRPISYDCKIALFICLQVKTKKLQFFLKILIFLLNFMLILLYFVVLLFLKSCSTVKALPTQVARVSFLYTNQKNNLQKYKLDIFIANVFDILL